VYDSRFNQDGLIRRKRLCGGCGYRFATLEVIDKHNTLSQVQRVIKPKVVKPKVVKKPKPVKAPKVVDKSKMAENFLDDFESFETDSDVQDFMKGISLD
jgi:transcriptional regulator NrdR family protein